MYRIGNIIRTAFGALCLLLLAGCSAKGVIGRKEMINLMADMYLADRALEVRPNLMLQKDSILVYPAVMDKHGVTIEEYEASIRYYMDDGDSYIQILRDVKKMLSNREKELSQLVKAEVEERDSRKLQPWWALDSIKVLSPQELVYDPYLRSVRWIVMQNEQLYNWQFHEPVNEDWPANAKWWANTLVPPTREFKEVFLKNINKKEETESNEKTGGKLLSDPGQRKALIKKRVSGSK